MSVQDALRAKNNPQDAFILIRFEVNKLKNLMRQDAASDSDVFSTLNKIVDLTGGS